MFKQNHQHQQQQQQQILTRDVEQRSTVVSPAVLILGFTLSAGDGSAVIQTNSGTEAIERLRMSQVDLVVVAPRIGDMSVWDLLRTMRTAWPWQRWALLADDTIGPSEEIRARSLGVSRIFDDVPTIDELNALARPNKPGRSSK